MTVYTVGHSTRSLEDLLAILQPAGVRQLVDVRRFPRSRRHPHFSREPLERALEAAGIAYRWMEALGGRRSRRTGSPHTAWRVAGFQGYADYMDTGAFREAAAALVAWAGQQPTAIMCAEARPEQCHRRLLADWLTVQGCRVVHLRAPNRKTLHELPEFARPAAGGVVYDGGQLSLRGDPPADTD